MGHEASGEITAIGPGVEGWRVGERVTFDSTLSCGECAYCRNGQVNLCENRRVVGVSPAEYKQHGAFAEFLALPARILYRLPDSLPFEKAAMVEPVSIAIHAVKRAPISPEDVVVVVGSGMIGLFVIQALRWAGARRIVAVDLEEKRLALARELGATDTINSGAGEVPAEVARLTGGRGADLAFEVVGISATLNLALAVLRRGGSAVLVGNLAPKADFPLQGVVTKELTIYGSCASAGEYPLCLDLISRGVIRVGPMISVVAPLAEGKEWFRRLSAKDGGKFMKVILAP
jgi:L-iditol 2-dehydrogenase